MDEYDIDWADVVDMLASEYGWTVEYISTLDLGQVVALKKKIHERHRTQNGESVDSDISSPTGVINLDENSQDISYFEKNAGGKRNVREDGTVEIII